MSGVFFDSYVRGDFQFSFIRNEFAVRLPLDLIVNCGLRWSATSTLIQVRGNWLYLDGEVCRLGLGLYLPKHRYTRLDAPVRLVLRRDYNIYAALGMEDVYSDVYEDFLKKISKVKLNGQKERK